MGLPLVVSVECRHAEFFLFFLQRVDTVRRAFKQQLSDAISRMHTYYTVRIQNPQVPLQESICIHNFEPFLMKLISL